MHLRWSVRDQKGQCSVNLRIVDHVIVIEDKAEFHWEDRHGVDQSGQDGLRPMGLGELSRASARSPTPGCKTLQSGYHVGPKTRRIVVARIQRYPGRRQFALTKPIGDQGCFAETGRGCDESYGLCEAIVQLGS